MMNKVMLRKALVDVVASISGINGDTVRDEDRLVEDLGLDSMAWIDLFSDVNDRLALGLSIRDVVGAKTVGEAVQKTYDGYVKARAA